MTPLEAGAPPADVLKYNLPDLSPAPRRSSPPFPAGALKEKVFTFKKFLGGAFSRGPTQAEPKTGVIK